MNVDTCFVGDVFDGLRTFDDGCVQTCVTSPPYWGLRDYGVDGQIGLEPTVDEYVEKMGAVFREVWRVLGDDATLWLNLGDAYAGSWGAQSRPNGSDNGSTLQGGSLLSARQIAAHPNATGVGSTKRTPGLKPKDLIGLPWRLAFALQADGWYLRSDIIWSKSNPMPESVKDRPTRAHEYIFLMSKSARYFYDADAIRDPATNEHRKTPSGWDTGEGGHRRLTGRYAKTDKQRGHGRRHDGFNDRWDAMTKEEQRALGANKRTVWNVATHPFPEAHFATFPEKLIEPCVLAGSRPGDIVLDPFMGSGTVAAVAQRLGRRWLGCELNPEYVEMQKQRTAQMAMELS